MSSKRYPLSTRFEVKLKAGLIRWEIFVLLSYSRRRMERLDGEAGKLVRDAACSGAMAEKLGNTVTCPPPTTTGICSSRRPESTLQWSHPMSNNAPHLPTSMPVQVFCGARFNYSLSRGHLPSESSRVSAGGNQEGIRSVTFDRSEPSSTIKAFLYSCGTDVREAILRVRVIEITPFEFYGCGSRGWNRLFSLRRTQSDFCESGLDR